MACPGCGQKSGTSWSILRAARPQRSMLGRLLSRLRPERRLGMASRAPARVRAESYLDENMRFNLAAMLADTPFPVYGLRGRPFGLRLRSPGYGGRGASDGQAPISHVSLGYTAGNFREPELALDLDQGLALEDQVDSDGLSSMDQSALEEAIYSFGSSALRENYQRRGDFNREWNLEALHRTPRQTATLRVEGQPTEADLWQWSDPLQVVLVRFSVGRLPFVAVSLAMTGTELIEALSTLGPLKGDGEATANHQREFDENSRLRRQRRELGTGS